VASAVELFSDRAVLEMGIFGALLALGCFLAIGPKRPVISVWPVINAA
jgi:hypothetical protein